MKTKLILTILLLALAGCGGGGTDADGNPDQTTIPVDCKAEPKACM